MDQFVASRRTRHLCHNGGAKERREPESNGLGADWSRMKEEEEGEEEAGDAVSSEYGMKHAMAMSV